MSIDDRLCYCADCECMAIHECFSKDCNCCTYVNQKGEDTHYGDYPDTAESGQTYDMEMEK